MPSLALRVSVRTIPGLCECRGAGSPPLIAVSSSWPSPQPEAPARDLSDRHRRRHARQIARTRQITCRPIRRSIINNDQLPRRPRLFPERGEALLSKFELVRTR
jgi:hypothetical protein